jgi:hypothetical protein
MTLITWNKNEWISVKWDDRKVLDFCLGINVTQMTQEVKNHWFSKPKEQGPIF